MYHITLNSGWGFFQLQLICWEASVGGGLYEEEACNVSYYTLSTKTFVKLKSERLTV